MSVNRIASHPLRLFAFLSSLKAIVLMSLLTMHMVEMLSFQEELFILKQDMESFYLES